MSDFMDMELVVRLDGGVQETNLTEFEKEAHLILDNINTNLQTDEDFAVADVVSKDCKTVEIRIEQAKQDALHSIDDISALFTVMDKLHSKFRSTRLNLEKKVKTEKGKRKQQIVDTAATMIADTLNGSSVKHCDSFYPSRYMSDLQEAVKNKKTIASMEEAVSEIRGWYYDEIDRMSDLYSENLKNTTNANSMYPGLFPDQKTLCLKTVDEVNAIITSRINQHKLDLIEREQELKEKEAKEREREVEPLVEKEIVVEDFPAVDDFPKPKEITLQFLISMTGPERDIRSVIEILEANDMTTSISYPAPWSDYE